MSITQVREALEISKRGCDELLVENEWLNKLTLKRGIYVLQVGKHRFARFNLT